MEVSEVDFNEILQQASQLTAEIECTNELPRVQRNLRQVLEAGQQLLERTTRDGPRIDADIKAAIFLGTKGVDVTKLSEKLDPIYLGASSIDVLEPASEVDVEDFLKNERMNAMCAVVESTACNLMQEIEDKIWMKQDEEWKREKEELLASLSGSLKTLQFEKVMYGFNPDSISPLSQTELTYAHEISQYNNASINGLPKPNLIERLQMAAKNSGDSNIQELWSTAAAMASNLPVDSYENLIHRKSSEPFMDAMISRAKRFLESRYFTKLKTEAYKDRTNSTIGGTLGAIHLVKQFIFSKGLDNMNGLDVAAGDVGPVWLITYILLRCGRVGDAVIYMRDSVCNNDTAKLLEDYEKSGNSHLPLEIESKIRMEYRRALKNSTRDPYKKAVYCILGGCNVEEDLTDVAHRLDDYLWLKLAVIRHNQDQHYTSDFITYEMFQTQILEEYGEVYFDAFKQPYVYAQALLLTGQFEAAIEFMSRVNGMLSHAIHVAIAFNESNLISISEPSAPMLILLEGDNSHLKALNYCKLMVTFSRSLQGSNARDALNYLYLLKNIKGKQGHDLFSVCVGDMILDSRDFDVFGVMNTDGCKTPGLLEQMGIPAQPIVLRCAAESENSGLLEDAVILYDLAGNHDQTLRILCQVLGQHLNKPPLPDSPRQRIQRLAISYAERFQNHPPKALKDPGLLATFYVLVDFMTFFDTVHAKQVDASLSIIQRLKVIPMEKADVEKCKADFHTFSDEIRVNIPNLIVAAMEIIHMKYQTIKAGRKSSFVTSDVTKTESFLEDLKSKAQAIVTYSGMIPYFMTGDVYSKVMQIEVQMN